MRTDDEIRQTIRKNLIELRKMNGKTQSDIAALTGKSENAVGSWEQGLSLPDITTLFKISQYYKRSVDYMYEEHQEGK